MREGAITKSILADLKERPGVFAMKNHGGRFGRSGRPDIEVTFRDRPGSEAHAITVFVEVKQPGKQPTELQKQTIAALRSVGAVVLVVWSKQEAIELLSSLGLPPKAVRPKKSPQRRSENEVL